MPTVQGYSSSEDEACLPELPKYEIPRFLKSDIENLLLVQLPMVDSNRNQGTKKRVMDEATFKLESKVFDLKPIKESSRFNTPKKRKKQNVEDESYKGPWANFNSDDDKGTLDQEESVNDQHKSVDYQPLDGISIDVKTPQPTSEFVGSSILDHEGRSYMYIPKDFATLSNKQGTPECFAPKSLIHTFKGHKKGVTKLDIYHHLLLSAGNDCKIMLWNLHNNRELLRIFHGHSQAVTDISFNSSGKKFLSCGFDRVVHVWDTETGEILKTIQVKSIPNVVKFNPNKESEILVGLSNKKIEHYDLIKLNFNDPIQTYDHHLGAINTITIVENNNRFMTTSDDKSVRFWDWQINIPCKVISDPSQHSMPAAVVHPGGSFIALQSMDNRIRVIQGHGKFKFAKKKPFTGHQVAGYGIEIDISADGKVLMSGDAKGHGFFWEWKTGKLINKIKVSNKPITCIKSLRQKSSTVVMAGISGEIYYCE
jgi:pre-mRNA-processing factor 17